MDIPRSEYESLKAIAESARILVAGQEQGQDPYFEAEWKRLNEQIKRWTDVQKEWEEIELTPEHFTEALERANIFCEMADLLLWQHPVFSQVPELRLRVEKIQTIAGALYQAVGRVVAERE